MIRIRKRWFAFTAYNGRTHTLWISYDWHYWLSQLNVHSFTIYSPNEHHSLQLKCFDGKSLAVHVCSKQKQIRIRDVKRGKRNLKRTSCLCGVRQKRQSVLIIIIIIIFLRLMSNIQLPRTLINWVHLSHKQQSPIHFWFCMEYKAPINFYAFQLKYFGTVMTTHHPI